MVFYFTSIDDSYVVYMGKDKYENEGLIKYAFPEDVWFHVDNFSSAHVYLRLKPFEDISQIPAAVLEDMAQLTKENSIEGKKQPSVRVIYTLASNLKKTGDMDIGSVTFHDRSKVHTINVPKRNREIVNRLRKTKREDHPDLAKLLENHLKQQREAKKKQAKEKLKNERLEIEKKRAEQEAKSYDTLFAKVDQKKASNKRNADLMDDVFGEADDYEGNFDDLDDFM